MLASNLVSSYLKSYDIERAKHTGRVLPEHRSIAQGKGEDILGFPVEYYTQGPFPPFRQETLPKHSKENPANKLIQVPVVNRGVAKTQFPKLSSSQPVSVPKAQVFVSTFNARHKFPNTLPCKSTIRKVQQRVVKQPTTLNASSKFLENHFDKFVNREESADSPILFIDGNSPGDSTSKPKKNKKRLRKRIKWVNPRYASEQANGKNDVEHKTSQSELRSIGSKSELGKQGSQTGHTMSLPDFGELKRRWEKEMQTKENELQDNVGQSMYGQKLQAMSFLPRSLTCELQKHYAISALLGDTESNPPSKSAFYSKQGNTWEKMNENERMQRQSFRLQHKSKLVALDQTTKLKNKQQRKGKNERSSLLRMKERRTKSKKLTIR
mmetsp:Transcript_24493/g.39821  ORF Transcript_24493/g.39821 Transcript_24493/m.39821 type:complete len:381 (+) Transcript_24493:3877-5019(+)